MKTIAIDHVLKTIETHADVKRLALDTIPAYGEVCQIVTDYDYDGIVPTDDQKIFMASVLATLCQILGINYAKVLEEALMKTFQEE